MREAELQITTGKLTKEKCYEVAQLVHAESGTLNGTPFVIPLPGGTITLDAKTWLLKEVRVEDVTNYDQMPLPVRQEYIAHLELVPAANDSGNLYDFAANIGSQSTITITSRPAFPR